MDTAAAGTSLACFGQSIICVFWLFGIVMFFVSILGTIFWVFMLVDVVKREEDQFGSESKDQKMLWLLVVILTSWIGALVYYFMVVKKMGRAV